MCRYVHQPALQCAVLSINLFRADENYQRNAAWMVSLLLRRPGKSLPKIHSPVHVYTANLLELLL